jgi:hypothetical protein
MSNGVATVMLALVWVVTLVLWTVVVSGDALIGVCLVMIGLIEGPVSDSALTVPGRPLSLPPSY